MTDRSTSCGGAGALVDLAGLAAGSTWPTGVLGLPVTSSVSTAASATGAIGAACAAAATGLAAGIASSSAINPLPAFSSPRRNAAVGPPAPAPLVEARSLRARSTICRKRSSSRCRGAATRSTSTCAVSRMIRSMVVTVAASNRGVVITVRPESSSNSSTVPSLRILPP